MLDREVRALFDGTRFVRPVAASATELRERIAAAVGQARAMRTWLSYHERKLLDRLAPLASQDGFKLSCEQANRKHETAEARKRQAARLTPRLVALDQEVSAFFDGKHYVRHWAANGLRERIAAAVEQAKAVQELLPERECGLLDCLVLLASPEGFKRRCEQANRQFEAAETQKKQAARLAPRLVALDQEVSAFFDGKRYIRHSTAPEEMRERIAAAVEQGKVVRKWLSENERRLLNRLVQIGSSKNFERRRERANAKYVRVTAANMLKTLRRKGTTPTGEQAEAIATDEDVTLVLAGAGTGKTAVITDKVAHLVRDCGVRPGRILVLAFNSDAAEEIRKRLPTSLAADVHTFHAFGNRVLGGTKRISMLAEDDPHRRLFITQQLEEMLQDTILARPVLDFITSHLHPYRSPFDFTTPEEYTSYVRGVELRTLNGNLVKSFEELSIANFLTLHGVPFRYERSYPYTGTLYRPDFYVPLPDSGGIYLEHFALNRDGSAPWPGYSEDVSWKRGVHRRNGTTLIETQSWQFKDGNLLLTLRDRLEALGVEFRPLPPEAAIKRLHRDFAISRLAYLLDPFLHHVRSGRLDSLELRQRAESSADPDRSAVFLKVFDEVQQRYEHRLASDGEIDFHDQIHGSTDRIRSGRWQSPYRYVLVDEFQDISAERMALLAALCGPDTAFFLVGDDWQSIYRFTGSDVGLVRDSGKHLGHMREHALTQTFRFGPGVSEPSTAFVRRNPAQTQRELRPARHPPPVGNITVIKASDPVLGLQQGLREIANLLPRDAQAPSVLVLGRYRDSHSVLQDANVPLRLRSRVRFQTVHKAKGLEADFVVVLDLVDRRRGFPSRVEDDPLLDLVAPPTEPYPNAEERRVFYVALTRGRRGAWLIADAERPSAFVNELLDEYNPTARYRVHVIDTLATEDPGPFDEFSTDDDFLSADDLPF